MCIRDRINAGSGNDYLIVGDSSSGSSYKGGKGFDVITFGSNTISEDIIISEFEVWNFAGEYPFYFDSLGNQVNYLSGEININGYSSSQGDFILSNSNFAGLNSKLQIVDWVYTNEFDASDVTSGHGIIFRKSKDNYNSNEQAIIKGSQLDDEYYGCPVDDKFQGNGGDDYFDGGLGIDIAIFSGNKSDYTITEVSYGNYKVVDNRSNNVEVSELIDEEATITSVKSDGTCLLYTSDAADE